MSDFLIQIAGALDEAVVVDALRSREGMAESRVAQFSFAWGSAVVQETRGFGYDPVQLGDVVYFAMGRPRVIGLTHEVEGPQGFTRRWAAWAQADDIARKYRDLTGLFVLVLCGPEQVLLVTDRLGYYAAYVGRDRHGRIRAIGTIPDLVARAAERGSDIDLVSLGEFLVRSTPTFPYTTYRGVLELAPGSMHNIDLRGEGIRHAEQSLWLPAEPPRYPTLKQLRDQLRSAIRTAGQELTRGVARVAVTLSGGTDSRTVLSSVPARQRAAALTFMDHDNYEFQVAHRVAKACGVPHYAVVRQPEFYTGLPERESFLLGLARTAMHAHALALVDAGSARQFDLVLSGLCADTLLKGWFVPENIRALLAQRFGIPAYLRTRLFPRRYTWADPNPPGTLWAMRPHIRTEMQQREATRLAQLAGFRPETAAEWIGFYPLSRGNAASYPMCNMRLFASDELYLYRDVIEVARCCPVLPKMMDRLSAPVFTELCGPLANIEITKTGLPPRLGWLQTRLRLRLRGLRRRSTPTALDVNDAPWFTEDSWVDWRTMQLHSPAWAELRSRASTAPALDVLASVLQIDPRTVLAEYQECLSCEFQVAMVQLALCLGAPAVRVSEGHLAMSGKS